MRNRLARLALAAVVALCAVTLFGALTLFWDGAPADIPASSVPVAQAHELAAPAALRAISIPFGIGASFALTSGTGELNVSGHAVCWEESQLFELRVRVAQSTTNAFAEGQSIDICANGERQMWDAQAIVGSGPEFEPGPARACAEAIEYGQHGTVQTHNWCKDIEFTAP